jgi:phosphoenolpyruvate---glycerone phosphotransferase subunit DhaK
MRKFINKSKDFVNEMIEGILLAHPADLKYINDDLKCLISCKKREGKVGLCTGGGSGHLPLFLGYIGEGMLDGCAVGNVFASPSSAQIYEITKEIDTGAGVLYIYGNYGGDVMNFDMAAEMADLDGIKADQIVVGDDVASAKIEMQHKRRGVAGLFYAYKIAGAAADEMRPLEEVKAVTEKALSLTRSMGAALSPCIIPEVGKPSFLINEDEIEIGMGIHGEPGISREKMLTADETADRIMSRIAAELSLHEKDEVSVLINGLGATPKEELYIIYRRVAQLLKNISVRIHRPYIGEFATSMEMSGMSITVMKLDDELKRLVDKPVYTPFFQQMK